MYIRKILVVVALLGIVAMAIFGYYVYDAIFSPNTAFEKKQVSVFVETDASYKQVREQLQPLLKDMKSFDEVAQRKGYISNIKPGRYIIKKGMNNNELINTLRSKNVPVHVVFNNQERLEELAGRVAEQIEADSVSLYNAMTDSDFMNKNNIDRENVISLFIPNKYEFYWNTSAEEFVERMAKEYNRFWNEERIAQAKKIGLSPKEVSTLAAIVQKETAQVSERPKVAGVYMNRLNRGMKLDADPTVIYAVKHKTQNFDTIIKRVLYKDLETISPYNTYRNAGLPPGPIAMPDISSINAVLNYEKHDYIFFVADVQNMGFHRFGRTLREHNQNKQEYVNWLRRNKINR